MRAAEIRQAILELASAPDTQLTLALVVREFGLTAPKARETLDAMVSDGILELDSFDDGTLYYHAPGLRHAPLATSLSQALNRHRERSIAHRTKPNVALRVTATVSVLDFVGVGLAALFAHSREGDILLWVALAGAPGTLATIVWFLVRWLNRRVTP